MNVMVLGAEEVLVCKAIMSWRQLEHVLELTYQVQMERNIIGNWRVGI